MASPALSSPAVTSHQTVTAQDLAAGHNTSITIDSTGSTTLSGASDLGGAGASESNRGICARRGGVIDSDVIRGAVSCSDVRRGAVSGSDGRRGAVSGSDGRRGAVSGSDGRRGAVSGDSLDGEVITELRVVGVTNTGVIRKRSFKVSHFCPLTKENRICRAKLEQRRKLVVLVK